MMELTTSRNQSLQDIVLALTQEVEALKKQVQAPPAIKVVSGKKTVPPTAESVLQYSAEIGLPPNEGHNFFDYWESWGWKRKGVLMKCWRASLRTWQRRWQANNPAPIRVEDPTTDPAYRKHVSDLHNRLRNDAHN